MEQDVGAYGPCLGAVQWKIMDMKKFLVALIPGTLKPAWRRLEASPLGYRLASGAFWSLWGGVLSRALNVFASVLVARILGRETFGELGTVQNTVAMFMVFAGFGTGTTATKCVAEHRVRDPQRAQQIITLSSAVTLVTSGVGAITLFILAPWLAKKSLSAPHLTETLQVASLLLLAS